MEYIVFGLILFILAVAGTFIYDHFKAEVAQHGGLFKAKPSTTAPTRKTKPISMSDAEAEFERKFAELQAKARQRRSSSATITSRDGSLNSTMSVEELIRRLEKMKKDI